MATFTALVTDEEPLEVAESGFWRSAESAQTLLSAALPDLRCPICHNDKFVLVREFEPPRSVQITMHDLKEPDRFTAYIATVAMHCDDCGYFLFFSEDELLKRAERKK
jgi:hypothetical protein